MNTVSSWVRAIRRVVCCGPGAEDDPIGTNEPVYETLGHQVHDAASAMEVQMEWVDEIRWQIAPIADVPERMRRLELSLHPLLVYRPDEDEYMDMLNDLRSAPAAQATEPPTRSVWLAWLQERVDYGEPW